VEGFTEKAIFLSVTVYSKNLPSQCNLPAQIEQMQDKTGYLRNRKIGMEFATQTRERRLYYNCYCVYSNTVSKKRYQKGHQKL